MKGITQNIPEVLVSLIVNGYIIHGFSWTQHDPNNLATARVEVVYSLAEIAADGTARPSLVPEHQGIKIAVYDSGDNKRLTRWLEESGEPEDLLDWSYLDIIRLVQDDIRERFGYVLS